MEASIEDYAKWEDFYVIKARFPKSTSWGQVISPAGGDVTDVTA
jgi:hypothetical protein